MLGRRIYLTDGSNVTEKRNIMWREYCSYFDKGVSDSNNPDQAPQANCRSIYRERTMVLIDKIYITFELFERPLPQEGQVLEFITMNIMAGQLFMNMSQLDQLKEIKDKLPSFVMEAFEQDITDTKEFRLDEMCKKGWRLQEGLERKLVKTQSKE